jgi:hypothetical protein
MYRVNEDNSIYVTRGDIAFIHVSIDNDGKPYTFQVGEVLRLKVYGKKNCEDVVLQKDFPVTAITQEMVLYLTESDTKIGDVISKPKDYWYEIELNPYDDPQTVIGYDEDGARVFKLFPEGADVPEYVPEPEDVKIIDEELDMTSMRPVQNQAIARAFANLQDGYQRTHDAVAALHVTPQMFGAIADGVSDDTEAIKRMIEYAASKAFGDRWKCVPKIVFPHGTYLVSEPLLNDEKYKACRFIIEGAGYTNTTIKVAAECPVLFPNPDIYGFTQFSNLAFVGADHTQTFMEELSGVTHNAQSIYFHRCSFSQFHTVLKLGKATGASVATMTSETLFSECKISNCGTAEKPCEIFILENQQSVNNRFYATDIESFVGVLFKYKEGNAITYYQGSIIPMSGSTIVDGTELNGNTSGGGNKPSLTMWGCRFELRGNTKLLNIGENWGGLVLSFNECGMGCSNLDSGVKPISIKGTGSAEIYFTRCRNTKTMYCEFANVNSLTSRENVLSRVHFSECDMNVKDFIDNSTYTFTGSNVYVSHPEIKIDGIYYNLHEVVRNAPLGNHLRVLDVSMLDGVNQKGYGCGSTSKKAEYTVNICSYIQEITLINIGNAVYQGYTTNKLKCDFYNENGTLIGTISNIPVSSGSGKLTLNKYVKSLKLSFSTDLATAPDLPVLALAKIVG